MLCSNRTSPYSPHEQSGSLSNPTCLLDVVFLPLSAIVFLVLLGVAIVSKASGFISYHRNKWIHILDIFLAIALSALQVLEIARLANSNEGIGLLPITLFGLLCAVATTIYQTSAFPSRCALPLAIFYFIFAIMIAANIALWANVAKVDPATSKYPSSDKVVDLAVVLALSLIACASQVQNWVTGRRALHHERDFGMK